MKHRRSLLDSLPVILLPFLLHLLFAATRLFAFYHSWRTDLRLPLGAAIHRAICSVLRVCSVQHSCLKEHYQSAIPLTY